jgi:hypothetical protein
MHRFVVVVVFVLAAAVEVKLDGRMNDAWLQE